jgi:Secretion system C-terminal sorting domain
VGLSDSAAANPTATGLGATTIYHVLITDANGCTATDSATITVTGATLNVTISAIGDRTWCYGTASSINLTAHASGGGGAPYTYLWIPSTYLSSTTDSTTVASPTPVGNYNYTVVVTDHLGCQGSAVAPVSVLAVPAATIVALDTTHPCQGDSVHLTATPGVNYTYQWLQGGNAIGGATSINYTTVSAGNYAVAIYNNTCGDTSAPVQITVRPNPVAILTAPNGFTFCAGSSAILNAGAGANYTYQWFENGYGIAGATSSTYSASDSGSFSVAVTLNGCTEQSDTLTDTINPVPNDSVAVGGATTFCAGGNVTLLAQPGSGYSYQWQNNGLNINGANAADFIADSTGIYSVVVTSLNCSATSTGVDVTVNPYPSANVFAPTDTQFCQHDSAVLGVTSGNAIYQWFVNGDTIDGATFSNYVAYNSGEYSVAVTANGCTSISGNVGIDVVALPEPVIYQSNDTMFASPASTYQWYQDSTLIPGATQQIYVSTIAGNYTVVETDSGMCAQSSLPFTFVPTGIAPVEFTTSVLVYPNPAHNAVNINVGINAEATITIRVYDMIGNEVAEPLQAKTIIGNNSYNLSLTALPASIYMLRIYDGRNTITKKIVKQ